MGNQTNHTLQNLFFISGIIVGLITVIKFVLPYFSDSNKEVQADNHQIVTKPQTVIGGAQLDNTNKPQLEPDTTVANDQPIKPKSIESKQTKPKPDTKTRSIPDTATKIEHYTVYADGTAIDNNTGMMWMRCSLGQEWNGSTCVGEAKRYTWDDAFKAIEELNRTGYEGYHGWELPNIEDLYGLVYCSTGFERIIIIPAKAGGKKPIKHACKDWEKLKQHPTINQTVFPNTPHKSYGWYWSASPYTNHSNFAWGVGFNGGYADYDGNKANNLYVRAARAAN